MHPDLIFRPESTSSLIRTLQNNAVYICAFDCLRPPALESVGSFTHEGEKAIGFPKAGLMDEVVNSVIILIFKEG